MTNTHTLPVVKSADTALEILIKGEDCFLVVDGVPTFARLVLKDTLLRAQQIKNGAKSTTWSTLVAAAEGVEDNPEETAAALAEAAKEIYTTDSPREVSWKLNPFRLKRASYADKVPAIDWLVPYRIHGKGLMQMYGASFTGKTLAALDLALSVATGQTMWMNHQLNTGGEMQKVLYVAAEGGQAFWVHVGAWLEAHPDVDREKFEDYFFVLDGGAGDFVQLDSITDPAPVATNFVRLIKELKEVDATQLAMVVYDTQIDLTPGINENNNNEMVAALATLKSFAETGGHVAVVVHHTGHNGEEARGASGMKAKCDVYVRLQHLSKVDGTVQWMWSEGKVKGAPEVPDSENDVFQKMHRGNTSLQSEGAYVTPITGWERTMAVAGKNKPDQGTMDIITKALELGEKAPSALGALIGKDTSKKYGPVLEYMETANLIRSNGLATTKKRYFLVSSDA